MANEPEALHKNAHGRGLGRGLELELAPDGGARGFVRALTSAATFRKSRTGSTCNASIRAANDSGPRRLTVVDLVVIHCTESPNVHGGARAVANYFHGGGGAGSTQLVLDDWECYRTLPDSVIPWGAPSANTRGVHIEQCGYTAWSRAQWLEHLPTIKRCAYKTALYCRRFHIPTVWLTAHDLRAGKSGVTSHANVSAAWPSSGHSDPGTHYPYDKLKWWTHTYWEKMG